MRSLSGADGPTLVGEGTVGELILRLPGLLFARPAGFDLGDAPGPGAGGCAALEGLPSGEPLRRAFRLRQGARALDLRFPVPTPEVTGGEGPGTEAAPRVLLVRTPLAPACREQLAAAPWDLVVWSNARAAFTQSARFVREAVELRTAAGPGPMVWAPRVATPGRLALLFGLGLDLLDTTEGLAAVAAGRWLSPEADDLEDLPAPGGALPLAARAAGVQEEFAQELQRVRRFARAGRLRELVEARLTGEPRRGELLRLFDRDGAAFQEEHTPVVGQAVRPYSTKEALRRPEVARFRARFRDRYRAPPSKRTLLLLPCSKTKPYARSPSHRRICRALEGLPQAWSVHVVSVTSPLGLVPRELECVYPARHYDIPVTGDWDEDERRWVRDALTSLRSSASYDRVVVHLPPGEYAWLQDLLPSEATTTWTVVGEETTSAASIAGLAMSLRAAPVRDAAPPSPPVGGALRTVREELRALAAFQFPGRLAEELFRGEVRLAGRPWFQRLVSERKEDLATWREGTGLWRLTVAGARKALAGTEGSQVEVRGGVELRGDLFAPGVAAASPSLRTGDDVVLIRQGEVLGVGEAKVPGPWMGRLPRGLVVKVRHRSHGEGEERVGSPPRDAPTTADP